MSSQKIRLSYIDVAKGILILLLVFSHLGTAARNIDINSTYVDKVRALNFLFSSFFMSGFLIYSGFVSSFDKKIQPFIISTFKSLVIPTITFYLIYLIYYSAIGRFDHIVSTFREVPNTNLWFMYALLFARLFYYGLNKVTNRGSVLLAVPFICLITGIALNSYYPNYNYCAVYHCLISVFFVAFGQFLKRNQTIYEHSLNWSPLVFIVCLAVATVSHCHPKFTANISVNLSEIPLFVVLACTGSLALLRLTKLIDKNSLLEFFGRNSLVIYGLHYLILKNCLVLAFSVLHYSSFKGFLLILVSAYIVIYALCWFVAWVFTKKPFSILIGKF